MAEAKSSRNTMYMIVVAFRDSDLLCARDRKDKLLLTLRKKKETKILFCVFIPPVSFIFADGYIL